MLQNEAKIRPHSENKGYQNGVPGVLLLQMVPFFQRGTLFSIFKSVMNFLICWESVLEEFSSSTISHLFWKRLMRTIVEHLLPHILNAYCFTNGFQFSLQRDAMAFLQTGQNMILWKTASSCIGLI